ncbi:MAG: hypothetical protein Q4B65_00850 [Candidatus Saccharibacteria bacterium]|nr:hypothetical protein [Candidatus Saccharibacteria bacterium]
MQKKNTKTTEAYGKAKIIKSKKRVRDAGEVFTQPREVNNILALTQATSNRYWRFLEPTCGNGNFLEAILRQRLEHLKQDRIEWHPKNREFSVLKILSTIYGVDIAKDNISECKKRLKNVVFEFLSKRSSGEFLLALDEILKTNLIVGDMLKGKDKIYFVEYSTPAKGMFKRRVFALTDMEAGKDEAVKEYPSVKIANMAPIDINTIRPPDSPPKKSKLEQTNLFGESI